MVNKDMSAMMEWVGTGAYVSRNPQIQKELFGDLPTVEEAVREVLPRQRTGVRPVDSVGGLRYIRFGR